MLNYWYIASYSKELKINKTLEVKILNNSIVLFRDEIGIASAISNICSHRNAPLSDGKVCKGKVQCPYHGWEFNKNGNCTHIPSILDQNNIPSSTKIKNYKVIEQDDYIWIWIGDREPKAEETPLKLELFSNYQRKLSAYLDNSVENCIENFMDPTHTGYIHGGLFRNSASHLTEATIKEVDDGIKVTVKEESKGDSILAKLIIGEDNGQIHEDYFILPSLVKVTYLIGKRFRIRSYHFFTPIEDFKTRIFVHVTLDFKILNPIMMLVVGIVGRILLKQDKDILSKQAKIIKEHGENFISAPVDVSSVKMRKFRLNSNLAKKSDNDKEISITYKL
ncbi:MAG: Rieske 2Fe-2S domain-containing protein [Candidatus Sericytochromatia bacterium]